MKIFLHRNKIKKIVIFCENENERSRLLSYAYNIGLTSTDDKMKFFASRSQVPQDDFENFKKNLLVATKQKGEK